MKIHLVGGFLGSGKTTAIANASKVLRENDFLCSIITHDQGNTWLIVTICKPLIFLRRKLPEDVFVAITINLIF